MALPLSLADAELASMIEVPAGAFGAVQGAIAKRVLLVGTNGQALMTSLTLADSLPIPSTGLVGAAGLLYNGTSLDLQRNNQSAVVAIASGARTSTQTFNFTNYNARGIALCLSVTAKAVATTLNIHVMENGSGNALTLASSGALAATAGQNSLFVVCPGVVSADFSTSYTTSVAVAKAVPLPRQVRVDVVPGDANSVTYSLAYILLP
jgi:hypothetical protein